MILERPNEEQGPFMTSASLYLVSTIDNKQISER